MNILLSSALFFLAPDDAGYAGGDKPRMPNTRIISIGM
jgi:hypothetical protein